MMSFKHQNRKSITLWGRQVTDCLPRTPDFWLVKIEPARPVFLQWRWKFPLSFAFPMRFCKQYWIIQRKTAFGPQTYKNFCCRVKLCMYFVSLASLLFLERVKTFHVNLFNVLLVKKSQRWNTTWPSAWNCILHWFWVEHNMQSSVWKWIHTKERTCSVLRIQQSHKRVDTRRRRVSLGRLRVMWVKLNHTVVILGSVQCSHLVPE